MNTEVKVAQPQAIGTKAQLLAIMERAKKHAAEFHEKYIDGKPNIIFQLEVNAYAEGAISERALFAEELRAKIQRALVLFVQKGSVPWALEKQLENEKLVAENQRLRQAIEFALIYEPSVDMHKIKDTAYPKLREALAPAAVEEPK
jgi:adenine deaminase